MSNNPDVESYFLLNGNLESDSSLWPEVGTNQELYDVFRVEQGVPLFLEEHLDRLFNGARELNLPLGENTPLLLSRLKELVGLQNKEEGNIRLSYFLSPDASRVEGYGARFIEHHYPEGSLYKTGVVCKLMYDERFRPTIKIANPDLRNRTNLVIEKEQIFETILVNHDGKITEGSRTNLFFIRQKRVYTAPDHMVLGGIIRKKVIIACKELGYPLEFRAIDTEHELPLMKAAFITGTSPRVLPINRIGEQSFNPGHPIIRNLMDHINGQVTRYIHSAKGDRETSKK
jgi:branched-chain amino acid aminotransferase